MLLAVSVSRGEDAVYVRGTALRLAVNAWRRRNGRHGAVVPAVGVQRSAVTPVHHEAGIDGVLDGQLLGRRNGSTRLDDRRRRVGRRLTTVAACDTATARRSLSTTRARDGNSLR